MRPASLIAVLAGIALLTTATTRAQEGRPAPAPAIPVAHYSEREDLKDKVRLSNEMAIKFVEIIGKKPKPWKRTIRVAPQGYFEVNGKTYAYFGFIATGAAEGDSWDDPVLEKFWEELFRLKRNELPLLKNFKP